MALRSPRGAEMPSDFQFAAAPEVWIPLEPPRGGIADLAIVGRLREGTTIVAARQDMDRVMEIVRRTIPVIKNSRPREWLVPLQQQVVGDVTPMLASLLTGVALVLLVACVNTSQLVLAQLQLRRRELALRSALGASTRRLAVEVLRRSRCSWQPAALRESPPRARGYNCCGCTARGSCPGFRR
ncbi:MAG: hypothetical protein U0163_16960 [Gemmatimonadaceae bacterium]